MKHVIKFRWAIIALWILAAAILTIFTPDLQKLVAEKGQITVPDGYRSKDANELLQKMSDDGISFKDLVLVFHKEDKLTEKDKESIATVIDKLHIEKATLEIDSIIDFTEDKEIEESTVSKDGTTILVPISAATEKQTIAELREGITKIADQIDVPHALTGESLIEEDIILNSEEGLKKTVYITVALILVILFVVFRSVVAPLVPLLTVGISYLVAEGIVSVLADTINFPLSTFTQIFLVAIMFGIGTDYCILVISRFKEEMNAHESIKDAVIETYRASGKTVFYAALAVFIGFLTIGLSQFSLYQSAVAVAVGVFVITIALVTIVPFFLVLLGKKLFWPFHKKAEHKESKLWGALGHFTWTRPLLSIGIILVITLPALLLFKGEQSYDNLAELSSDYDTVKAFEWVEKSFGPGEIMPVTVVMELNRKIENANDLQSIETITAAIEDIQGISKVRSATRPAGDIIEDFLLESQTDMLSDGLDEMMDGVTELRNGLDEAATEMKDQAPEIDEAKKGVQQLMDGTKQTNDGLGELQAYLKEIESGIMDGSLGAGEVEKGLKDVKKNLDATIKGHRDVLAGYQQLEQGLRQVSKEIAEMTKMEDFQPEEMINGLNAIEQSIDQMNEIVMTKDPSFQGNKAYLEAYGTTKHIIQEMKKEIKESLKSLEEMENIDQLFQKEIIAPLNELNRGYHEIIQGQEKLSAGLQALIQGVAELKDGLSEAAKGQGEIVKNIPTMRDGLSEIYGGQKQLKAAFSELQDGFTELSDGLTEGADGLGELHNGLDEVNRYLTEIDLSNRSEVVVIPDEAVEMDEFWEAADLYLSPNRQLVAFEAILDVHPYSKEAIQLIDDIEAKVHHELDKTNLDVKTFKIGGISSMNSDLNSVSAKDYKRTATIMLIGIFIILIFLLRSLVMPIYILLSLLLTYYTSLSFAEFIFVKLAGHDGLTWAIPFFSFVMLIALGVDYSIFLMSRFNEYQNGLLFERMTKTMRNMGTVIISATVILGGTFAAMLPSGVLSLLQIATVVIIGLALYALVILPLFTPICVKLLGKYNWWPFMKKESDN